MAAASHPPATLPPPSTQPFRSHSPFGAPAPEPYGASPYYYDDSKGQSHTHHHHHGAHHGAFQPPPPPPPYDSPTRAGGGPAAAAGPPGPVPSAVYVVPPKIEMQPWARKAWRWLVHSTTGVARVDLRRPTPPLPEQYDGNLLVVRSRQSVAANRGGGGGGGGGGFKRRGRQAEAPVPVPVMYTAPGYYPAVPPAGPIALAAATLPTPGQPLLMGARIKITRSFLIGGGRADTATTSSSTSSEEAEAEVEAEGPAAGAKAQAPSGGQQQQQQPPRPPRRRWQPSPLARSWAEKPLFDIGVGVNLDVDQQQIQPVARIKIKDLVSIKAAPLGLLKISRSIPLGPVALKVRYELPLAHATHFWEPPARLMVRLDSAAGSGVHLTPGGLEFDEQVVQFGRAVSLRASASLAFPRQLPLEQGEPPLRLQLHRLSLRSIW
ncbi:hypothetical protein PLESTF_000956800 [Pleodorina starrii]|nr:hypothetical protein PLESTM_001884900 [Pleodorina starrii]GLC70301.1 hypothetical protein PLESTF_000956800 [Pleodorina starrii]